MTSLVGEVVPQALGMAISPVPIVATILILLSPRARSAAPAFLGGWIAGVLVAVTVFTVLGAMRPPPDPDQRRLLLAVIDLSLGVMLAVLALHQWRSRPGPGEPAQLPGWLAAVTSLGPAKAAGLAALLSGANPKNLMLAVSAGVTIGTAGTVGTAGAADAASVIAVFTAIASTSVAVPVIAFLVAGRRLEGALNRLRVWLEHNSPAIMGTLLGVLGVVLMGKGLAAL